MLPILNRILNLPFGTLIGRFLILLALGLTEHALQLHLPLIVLGILQRPLGCLQGGCQFVYLLLKRSFGICDQGIPRLYFLSGLNQYLVNFQVHIEAMLDAGGLQQSAAVK